AQFFWCDGLQTPARVCGADECALFLRPLERVEAECRPMRGGIATGIHLLAELEEAEMAALVRTEAADLHVVAEQKRILRGLVFGACEELLLIVEAGAPREIRADLEVFALAVARHVRCVHAHGRYRVVRAAGCVDVMIAAPPTQLGRIDPALYLKAQRVRVRI